MRLLSVVTLSKQDEIVHQAFTVFYQYGFQSTAVDRLLVDSGISKRTLYKYFNTKEELIVAAIKHYHVVMMEQIIRDLEIRATTPKEKLLALFDMRRESMEANDFSGCFAMNAKLEYDGKPEEKYKDIEEACFHFFTQFEAFIVQLCQEAGCVNSKLTARQIMILFDGTIVYGRSVRDPNSADIAKALVEELLSQNEPLIKL